MSYFLDENVKSAIAAWNARQRPSYETIEVSPLSSTIGAEVRGINLKSEIGEQQTREIRHALAENLVLVFPDQTIQSEDHKRFGRRFGSLHRHALAAERKAAGDTSDTDVLSWKTDANSRNTPGNIWHNDVSCDENPIVLSILRITKGPPAGAGDTAFANLYLGYESLSPAFQRLLDGLTAIHDGAQLWASGYGARPETGVKFATAEHPVVATHPISGRRFLFVNEAFTSHIVQLRKPESDAVLNVIYRHIERNPAFQVRVHWKPNTLVMWDNWAAQHHAIWDYFPTERNGERVSVYTNERPSRAATH